MVVKPDTDIAGANLKGRGFKVSGPPSPSNLSSASFRCFFYNLFSFFHNVMLPFLSWTPPPPPPPSEKPDPPEHWLDTFYTYDITVCDTSTTKTRARCGSVVDWSLIVRWVVGSILHGGNPLTYFSFRPILHAWCNKDCGIIHITNLLLLMICFLAISVFIYHKSVNKMCWVRRLIK